MAEKKLSKLDDKTYLELSELPTENEWLTDCSNKSPQTARAYKSDLKQFKQYIGIKTLNDYRSVSSKHVIEYIAYLKKKYKARAVQRKISCVSSLFSYFCNKAALKTNPVLGLSRPRVNTAKGETEIISDKQAKALLNAPKKDTLEELRAKAIIATLLFHGLRRMEVANLKVSDIVQDGAVYVLKILGKGDKTRKVELHPLAHSIINSYLERAGNINTPDCPMFLPFRKLRDSKGNLTGLKTDAIYNIVKKYAKIAGIEGNFSPHSLRATCATKALYVKDLGTVQDWLGHAFPQTTRIYDKREKDASNSPTYVMNF